MTPTDVIPVQMQMQEWHSILQLLAKQPYEVSAPLIHTIQMQAARYEQQQQVTADPNTAAQRGAHLRAVPPVPPAPVVGPDLPAADPQATPDLAS